MAMPGALRDKLEENWRSFQRSQAHRELLDSVESLFRREHGELRVRYRPYRAKQNFAPSALSAVGHGSESSRQFQVTPCSFPVFFFRLFALSELTNRGYEFIFKDFCSILMTIHARK